MIPSLSALQSVEANAKPPANETPIAGLDPGTPAYYSNSAELPFSQGSTGLANWFSTPHPDYNMASLDFYGHLINKSGEITAFSTIVQQQFGLPNTFPYIAEYSVCNNNTHGYDLAPFLLLKESVHYQSHPFSVRADIDILEQQQIEIALASGDMAQPGASYVLSGKVIDTNLNSWEYSIQVTDSMGAVAIGYGPMSFLPQWLTTDQHTTIKQFYNGNVGAYLKATNDLLEGQGSYYQSLPLLQVNQFTLTKNGSVFSEGSSGQLWVDYVVQSFTEQSFPVLKKEANWQFLAIQFPPELSLNNFSGAIMFSQVEMPIPGTQDTSTLPTARFYHTGAVPNTNSALQPRCEWGMQDINFEAHDYWIDPKTNKQYPLKFTLTLGNEGDVNGYAKLEGEAIRKDQVVEGVNKYEGVYKVSGSLLVENYQLKTVNGYAWAEIH